jgi:hypothetical protein
MGSNAGIVHGDISSQKHDQSLHSCAHCPSGSSIWAILAKAYTVIRDKEGKKIAPLDQFLKPCCLGFGIIGVTDYLHELHWFVERTAEGETVLVQETSFNPCSLESASNMSDVDIVIPTSSPVNSERQSGGSPGSFMPQNRVMEESLWHASCAEDQAA